MSASAVWIARRKARVTHTCGGCGAKIEPGKLYEHIFTVVEGQPGFDANCMVCVNNRTPIHCGDDMGWGDELRRQTKAAADKWEAGQ